MDGYTPDGARAILSHCPIACHSCEAANTTEKRSRMQGGRPTPGKITAGTTDGTRILLGVSFAPGGSSLLLTEPRNFSVMSSLNFSGAISTISKVGS